jgi:hypothetical protein
MAALVVDLAISCASERAVGINFIGLGLTVLAVTVGFAFDAQALG